jgi:hypothetical protein
MKKEELKQMIREELKSVLSEQAYQWWMKPAEAETPDAHLNPSQVHEDVEDTVNEDEYDKKRDQHPYWGQTGRPYTPKSYGKPKTPAKSFRQVFTRALVATKIKYKDAEGKEHEATVSSLLKYPKDHPGYKAAARLYASSMARAPKDEGVCEGEGCLDEKSVPQPYNRKSARKMSKSQVELRKKIGQAMMRDEKKVSKFRKKYGDEWKDYLWASASAAAFRQSGGKSDDKRKK